MPQEKGSEARARPPERGEDARQEMKKPWSGRCRKKKAPERGRSRAREFALKGKERGMSRSGGKERDKEKMGMREIGFKGRSRLIFLQPHQQLKKTEKLLPGTGHEFSPCGAPLRILTPPRARDGR